MSKFYLSNFGDDSALKIYTVLKNNEMCEVQIEFDRDEVLISLAGGSEGDLSYRMNPNNWAEFISEVKSNPNDWLELIQKNSKAA